MEETTLVRDDLADAAMGVERIDDPEFGDTDRLEEIVAMELFKDNWLDRVDSVDATLRDCDREGLLEG